MQSTTENFIDVTIGHEAASQHGLITVAQLRELGVSRSTIRTRLANGQWLAADASVLRIAGTPVTWESRLLAAVLSAGGSAAASHAAAARLWCLPGFEEATPELTVVRSSSFRRREVIVHRVGDHSLDHPVRRFGIPTTPLGRTLLDLGAVDGRTRVEAAVRNALKRDLIDWDGLLDTLVLHGRRGRDGVATLRAILTRHIDKVAQVEGGLERLVLVLARYAKLPEPVLGYELRSNGATHRLKFAFPDQKVQLELKTEERLLRTGQKWTDEEATIGNAATLAGWKTLIYTDRDFLMRPGAMVREIRKTLHAARLP